MGFSLGSLFSNSSNSASTNSAASNTTDNRAVADNGAIIVGQNGTFTGTDGGAVKIAQYNAELMRYEAEHLSDGIKTMAQMGTDVLDRLGQSVTDVTAKSGANMAAAWSHQLDVSGDLMTSLSGAAKANADAGQVIAMAALNANQNDGATLSSVAKWAALAIAAVVGLRFLTSN